MSGPDDERYDQEPPVDRTRERARSAVSVPATLLIVNGLLSLLLSIVSLIQYSSIPEKFDAEIKKIKDNNQIPKEERDQQVNVLENMRPIMEGPWLLGWYILWLVCSLLVTLGGVRMIQLSGPALPTVSAVLSMIPCSVSCCCLLGLPAGIWALVVLNRSDVRTVMARRNNDELSSENPDLN